MTGRAEKNTLFFAFLLIVCVFGLFMLFIVLISNRLTQPIHEIRVLMEQTETTDIAKAVRINTTDDEIVAFGHAYENLLKRLGEAADTEKKLSILQLQAQFDALQAQVNPHFLYNVLNVISTRGLEDGDEGICEICGNLAGMLRYSTSNVERYAPVKDELDYMKRYVNLLQFRYEERIQVTITCDKSIEKEILPKIVLQQLIENSVLHGYNNEDVVMRIQVRGFRDNTGWYIRMEDNGEGIKEDVLHDLRRGIKEIREKIHVRNSAIEMEIGGMGLLNLYARLYLLYADKLVFEYIRRDEEGNVEGITRAVDEVDLDVQQGDFIAVLGHNGSGKSTLAKHINAILYPTEGTVWVDGMDTKDEKDLWNIRQEAGMVFQNPDNQIIGQVVEEDVGFGPENMGIPTEEIWARVEESLKAVGMYKYRKFSPNKLSGGQKQRVSIAGVIAMHPKCIILDEPTAMLDPNGRKEVVRAVRALNDVEGITVLLITHYMEEIIHADKVFVMDKGRIAMQGTPREIFSRVEHLKHLRLDVPQVTLLAHELKKSGVGLPDGILTVEELTQELMRLYHV